jgi:hypothetical protein
MSFPSQKAFAQQLREMQAGIDADLTDVKSVIFNQVEYTIPQLRKKIDGFLAAQQKVDNALDAYTAAVAAGRASRAEAEALRGQLQAFVSGRHGKNHPMLARYGFTPERPRRVSAATKAVSALRGKATRKERGTVSTKQRAKMPKGKVDEAIVAKLLDEEDEKPRKPVKIQMEVRQLRDGSGKGKNG